MDPLFASQEDYDAFQARHAQQSGKKGDLSTYSGNCYLGIDAGSTTTKVALVGEDGSLLYSFYDNNNGSTIATAIRAIGEIKEKLPGNRAHCLVLFHRLRRGFIKVCPDAG